MDDRTKAYLIVVAITLFVISGPLLVHFASRRYFSWNDLTIGMMLLVPLALFICFYVVWDSKRRFGPEWYKMWFKKFDVPPEVSKSPRVRAFKYVGLAVCILGGAYGILIQELEVAAFFVLTGYIIIYQGAREEIKYLPLDVRKVRERGYKITFFIWLSFLLGLIIWLISSILPLRL